MSLPALQSTLTMVTTKMLLKCIEVGFTLNHVRRITPSVENLKLAKEVVKTHTLKYLSLKLRKLVQSVVKDGIVGKVNWHQSKMLKQWLL